MSVAVRPAGLQSTKEARGGMKQPRASFVLPAARCLLPADERGNPVDGALGRVGRAIGEGAERGDPFIRGRAGVGLRLGRQEVECLPRQHERRVQDAPEERWHRESSRV